MNLFCFFKCSFAEPDWSDIEDFFSDLKLIVTLILESGHWLVRKIVINKFMKIQSMIGVCRRTCFYVFDSIRIRFQASKTIRLVPVKIILIQICNI